MARSTRIHTPGGLYYLVLRANAERQLFPHADDFSKFAALVARHVLTCDVRVLAFCWVSDEASFALAVSSAPLGRFVQRIAGQHAQHINRRAGVRGHLFRQRYRALVIAESQLPLVVSHLHLMPVRLGLAADPAEYLWSSHRSYLGLQSLSWVTPEPVLQLLEGASRNGGDAYHQLIRNEMGRRAELAAREGSSPADREREFLRRLVPVTPRASNDVAVLDRLIESVAARLNVRRDELQSRSRRRVLSLGRAVIAWHATRASIATLSEVARHLGRHPSTLSIAIERYRLRRPDLFGQALDDPPAGGFRS
jgi:putative transposase